LADGKLKGPKPTDERPKVTVDNAKPEEIKPSGFVPAKNIDDAQKSISRQFNIQVGEFGSFTLSKEELLNSTNKIGLELQRLENEYPGLSKLTTKPKSDSPYSGRELTVNIGSGKQNIGLYEPKLNEINIGPIEKQIGKPELGETYAWHSVHNDSLYTFRHEYAHAIHQQGLSAEAFEEWFFIYKGKDQDFWEKVVSEYGGCSSFELFSESFSKYTSTVYKKGALPEEVEGFFEKYLRRNNK
jgi:hypothetical protein